MKYGSVFLAFFAMTTLEAAKGMHCPVKFHRVGCSEDKVNDRALPNELINERDPINHHFNGILIDWGNFNTYLPAFACRCAEAAIAKGNKIFGLQFYAECWSGPSPAANEYFDKHGNVSQCCDSNYQMCGNSEICVGEENSNFVYEIVMDCPSSKLDLLYVLDGSKSIKPKNFNKIKQFVMNLNGKFDIGMNKTRVAVEQFAGKMDNIFHIFLKSFNINRNLKKINGYIADNVNYLDIWGTATGRALEKAGDVVFNGKGGDRSDVPDVLILLTGGAATDGMKQFAQAALLKKAGVKIITVGIGKPTKVKKFVKSLKKLASKASGSHEKLAFTADFDKLDSIANAVANEACH